MTEIIKPKLTEKIDVFVMKRIAGILNGKSSEELTTEFQNFILVQFERIRQHYEKHKLGDLEELKLQFLKEYQDTFIDVYESYQHMIEK